MSLNKEAKKLAVANAAEVLKDAQTVVLATYHGVTVDKLTKLRKNARSNNVYLHVLKNTLAQKAVADTAFAPLAEKMKGPLIYSISNDPILAAKIINDFSKENSEMKIIAGMCQDKMLDASAVKKLASIPGRLELLAQLLGTMKQIPASFVRAVAAIAEKKQGQ